MRVVVPPQIADLVPGKMLGLKSLKIASVLACFIVVCGSAFSKKRRFVCKILLA